MDQDGLFSSDEVLAGLLVAALVVYALFKWVTPGFAVTEAFVNAVMWVVIALGVFGLLRYLPRIAN